MKKIFYASYALLLSGSATIASGSLFEDVSNTDLPDLFATSLSNQPNTIQSLEEEIARERFEQDYLTFSSYRNSKDEAKKLPFEFKWILVKGGGCAHHESILTEEDSFSGGDMERKLYDSIYADLEDDIFHIEKALANWQLKYDESDKIIKNFYTKFALEKKLEIWKQRQEECNVALKIIEAYSVLHDPLQRINKLSKIGSMDDTVEAEIAILQEQFDSIKRSAYLKAISTEKQTKPKSSAYNQGHAKPLEISLEKLCTIATKEDIVNTYIKDFKGSKDITKGSEHITLKHVSQVLRELIERGIGFRELFEKIEENNVREFSSEMNTGELGYPPLDDDYPPLNDDASYPKVNFETATLYGDLVWEERDAIEKYLPALSNLENILSKEEKNYRVELRETRRDLEIFLKSQRANKTEKDNAASLKEMIESFEQLNPFSKDDSLTKDEKNLIKNIMNLKASLMNMFKYRLKNDKEIMHF